MDIWDELGIEPTDDRLVIRRAYARRLKANRPEDDPEGFERLRFAYDVALGAAIAVPAPVARESTWVIEPEPVSDPDPEPAPALEPETVPRPELDVDPDLEFESDAEPGPFSEESILCEKLWDSLVAGDDETATLLFGKVLAFESMTVFEARWQLEEWLLATLAQVEVPPTRLIAAASHEFRWDEDATRIPPHQQDLVDELLAEVELHDLLERFRNEASGNLWRAYKDRRPLAQKLLCDPPRPIWLDYAVLGEKTFAEMKALWEELEMFGPDALSRHLGNSTYEWWNKNIEPGAGWFLRFLQRAQRIGFGVSAVMAVYAAVFAPMLIISNAETTDVTLRFVVAYTAIALGMPSIIHVVTAGAALFLLRGGRRARLWTEKLGELAQDATVRLAGRLGCSRLNRWRVGLSKGQRRLIDLVVLVALACGFWVALVAVLTIGR